MTALLAAALAAPTLLELVDATLPPGPGVGRGSTDPWTLEVRLERDGWSARLPPEPVEAAVRIGVPHPFVVRAARKQATTKQALDEANRHAHDVADRRRLMLLVAEVMHLRERHPVDHAHRDRLSRRVVDDTTLSVLERYDHTTRLLTHDRLRDRFNTISRARERALSDWLGREFEGVDWPESSAWTLPIPSPAPRLETRLHQQALRRLDAERVPWLDFVQADITPRLGELGTTIGVDVPLPGTRRRVRQQARDRLASAQHRERRTERWSIAERREMTLEHDHLLREIDRTSAHRQAATDLLAVAPTATARREMAQRLYDATIAHLEAVHDLRRFQASFLTPREIEQKGAPEMATGR